VATLLPTAVPPAAADVAAPRACPVPQDPPAPPELQVSRDPADPPALPASACPVPQVLAVLRDLVDLLAPPVAAHKEIPARKVLPDLKVPRASASVVPAAPRVLQGVLARPAHVVLRASKVPLVRWDSVARRDAQAREVLKALPETPVLRVVRVPRANPVSPVNVVPLVLRVRSV